MSYAYNRRKKNRKQRKRAANGGVPEHLKRLGIKRVRKEILFRKF